MRCLPALILLGSATLPAFLLSAQVGDNRPIPPSWNQHPGGSATPNVVRNEHTSDPVERMLRGQKAKQEAKRLDDAQKDAARLVELANDLKKQVDVTSSGTVSAKASSEADQIVKLAKSIKKKMQPQ